MSSGVLSTDGAPALVKLFAGKSLAEQKALMAMLERSGAFLYRSWADQEAQRDAKEALLSAAVREEQNASLLEEDTGSATTHS